MGATLNKLYLNENNQIGRKATTFTLEPLTNKKHHYYIKNANGQYLNYTDNRTSDQDDPDGTYAWTNSPYEWEIREIDVYQNKGSHPRFWLITHEDKGSVAHFCRMRDLRETAAPYSLQQRNDTSNGTDKGTRDCFCAYLQEDV